MEGYFKFIVCVFGIGVLALVIIVIAAMVTNNTEVLQALF